VNILAKKNIKTTSQFFITGIIYELPSPSMMMVASGASTIVGKIIFKKQE
jgi:hypothetical protein